MRLLSGLLIWLLSLPIMAEEWVVPWVANRDGIWGSEIIINNHDGQGVDLTMIAVQPGGTTSQATTSVPATSQLVFNPGDMFSFESSSGYAVFINGETSHLTVAVRVASLEADSGFSPAMGLGQNVAESSANLVYPAMPADGFSAPVFLNPNQKAITLTVAAYTAAGQFGEPVTRTIGARQPLAVLVAGEGGLFPELAENAALIASADGVILGANFYFNPQKEPAMINAVPNTDIDATILDPLLTVLTTSSTVTTSYNDTFNRALLNKTAKRACPEPNVQFNIEQTQGFIDATFDWADGCTNALGIQHSGSIDIDMNRQGSLVNFGWLDGSVVFNNFTTQYNGTDVRIDGSTRVEGSSTSQNFSWSGNWTGSATIPIYGIAAGFDSTTFLSVNRSTETHKTYGHLDLTIDALYVYNISASIDPTNPLIYDYALGYWPTHGRIDFYVNYTGMRVSGSLDFDTGACNTANLTLYNTTNELILPSGCVATP